MPRDVSASRATIAAVSRWLRALELLASHPGTWSADWHATKSGTVLPPSLAGRKWRQRSNPLASRS